MKFPAFVLLFPSLLSIHGQAPATPSPAPPPASAASTQDVDVETAKLWIGRPAILRCLCEDGRTTYDTHGKLAEPARKITDWTLTGFDLQTVTRKDPEHIELTGTRVAIRYNDSSKLFDRKPIKTAVVHLQFAVTGKASETRRALDAALADGIDYRLQQSTTEAWKHYFNPGAPWPNDSLSGKGIRAASDKNPNIVPPQLLSKTEPDLTMESQTDRVAGSVLLRFVIDDDGSIHRISIVKPIGYGLDANVVAALQKFRFKPAARMSTPLPMEMYFEQKFIAPAAVR